MPEEEEERRSTPADPTEEPAPKQESSIALLIPQSQTGKCLGAAARTEECTWRI